MGPKKIPKDFSFINNDLKFFYDLIPDILALSVDVPEVDEALHAGAGQPVPARVELGGVHLALVSAKNNQSTKKVLKVLKDSDMCISLLNIRH